MRPLAAALALCVAACSSREVAEERRVLVDVGMTADQVRARIGGPQRTFKVPSTSSAADQTTEVWDYTIEAPPTVGDFAEMVLAAGALVLLVASRSSGSVSGGRSSRYRFYVGFGPDGRVRGVTNLAQVK